MEQRLKLALEIILAKCERDSYLDVRDIQLICETALKGESEEEGAEDECA